MRNQWVGDIGDFGRDGLLCTLFGTPDKPVDGLKLGVVWCLNKDDPSSNRIETPEKYRWLDQPLYDSLLKLVGDKRAIAEFQCGGILPTEIFFDKPICGLLRKKRTDWLEAAIEKTKEADVIFIDPDTGIAPGKMTQKDSSKKSRLTTRSAEHIFIDELKQLSDKGKSLIVYQHQNRTPPKEQVRLLAKRLRREGYIFNRIRVFSWHNRFFIVIVQRGHTLLIDALDRFQESNWSLSGYLTEETHWLGNLA